ncbi:MAG: hypothetical protein LBC88_05815, partial [Spirochaetaceae bacterium]|nr:hypothetical protein [Spirochaetaceae bacterium]
MNCNRSVFRSGMTSFAGLAILAFLAAATPSLAAEETGGDPSVFIGFSVRELVEIKGFPEAVYAVRGAEAWQDDVVFSYGEENFYFYRDRVWQVGTRSAFGIGVGDKRDVVPLIMGDHTVIAGDYSLAPLPGRAWPMNARFNIDEHGRVV